MTPDQMHRLVKMSHDDAVEKVKTPKYVAKSSTARKYSELIHCRGFIDGFALGVKMQSEATTGEATEDTSEDKIVQMNGGGKA